ncbi:class Ib ribonucleoside-diphosphate reductase assembly flavoprotein NrdI [Spiroplasma floricola]|uniref:Protein NrdI n=1 Tax=Spiroplasma floricola 23-6 TaxID=1336749 RepID=A0A2K8SEA7_9MOLU|nr:class Ib ribonucleoside-diphosphate reductase assembly flavoprotein NrdI [Spiroplasma floricola]AUB31160.1 ribonucleotide reductase [Spiroplasma floricola 23-6]
MHEDVIRISKKYIKKPKGEIFVVYFSSISNNTHRFMEKLDVNDSRIPYDLDEELIVEKEYVLITPTYAGGGGDTKGAVPAQVVKFLNKEVNRNLCRGVIASGNTNFGDTFAIAGPIISRKLKVPFLYQFELLGTKHDVNTVRKILNDLWEGKEND